MKERLEVGDWSATYEYEILTKMGQFHSWFVAAHRQANPDVNMRLFDREKRTFSEMPLCNAHIPVGIEIGMPAEFHLVKGSIETVGELTGFRVDVSHTFFSDEDENVLDLTAPQFVRHGKKPGDRTEAMREAAPEVVEVFTSGLVVLHASMEQLRDEVGLYYIPQQVIL